MCLIDSESYVFSADDILFKWDMSDGHIISGLNPELLQFKVTGYRKLEKLEPASNRYFSRLKCEIQFSRSIGYYLVNMYTPASLIVVTSWVPFWLHWKDSTGRVSLG